jgi:hypothetical protein
MSKAILIALLLAGAVGRTADWPEWRGPERTGASPERGLPVRWSAAENVAWTLPLPSGSGGTPIVSGERVFLGVADGPEVALWCLDRTTGRVTWKRPLGFGLQWGYGSSPLLEGDVLYVPVLHGMHTKEPSYLLGLDPATGKNRFRVERRTPAVRESPDAYTTPAVARRDGKAEIVLTGADVVTGHDPATVAHARLRPPHALVPAPSAAAT